MCEGLPVSVQNLESGDYRIKLALQVNINGEFYRADIFLVANLSL